MLLEGRVRPLFRRKLDELKDQLSVRTTEGTDTVVDLGDTGGHTKDRQLSLGLGNSNACIVSPELGQLEGDSIEVKVQGCSGSPRHGHCCRGE